MKNSERKLLTDSVTTVYCATMTSTITESPLQGGGAPLPSKPSCIGDFDLVERFWNKVRKTESCWIWTAALSKGYPQMSGRNRTNLKAHRFSWMIHFGHIPKGLFVCHHCDNPMCVRPDHLFLGTHQDNMDDMVNKGRTSLISGERNGLSKLTSEAVRKLRDFYATGEIGQRCLASMFGISQFNVSLIVREKTWNH